MKHVVTLLLGCVCPLVASADNITFVDENVKSVCVQNWDSNGDGELSMEEAAAVTNLRNKFGFNAEISNFPELQYFTGLISIATYDFYNCTKLRTVVLPPQITSIGSSCFFGCSDLQEIVIPNAVKTIGEYAFNGCNSMTSVTFPEGLETIGDYAFSSCNSLQRLAIPSTVTSIALSAFWSCSSLTAITVDTNNTVYDSRENCNAIIKTSTNTLQLGIANTVIPTTVTAIGPSAFYGNSRLLTIDIPEGVLTIDDSAFSGCSALTDVTFPSTLTSIGYTTFSGCKKLSSILLPEGLKTIDQMAFQNCTNLKKVSIPSTVTKMSYNVFAGCSKLTKVAVARTTPISIDASVFPYRKKSTLYVPEGCSGAYENANVWKDFKIIVERSLAVSATVAPLIISPGQSTGLSIAQSGDDFDSYRSISFDVTLPEGFTLDEGNITLSERCEGMSVKLTPQDDGSWHLLCSSDEKVVSGSEGTLLTMTMKAISDVEVGTYQALINNITFGCDNGGSVTHDDMTVEWQVVAPPLGDVNHDGYVNIYDVTLMIDYILDMKPSNFHVGEADLNDDGYINIYDVTLIIDIILNKE
ncbi:MAG: leucine-rich repeat protein [Prevotella sp.]|nr:leucine-rich repeat protein [Prevotella sp.]